MTLEQDATASGQANSQAEPESVSDYLSAAFDELSNAETVGEGDGDQIKDDIKVVDEDSISDDDDIDKDQKKPTVEPKSATTAPQHWPKADQDRFNAMANIEGGAEWQSWLLDRHGSLEKAFYEKSEGLANFRKTWEPVQELIEPFKNSGLNPSQLIQNWANIAQNMQSNPLQTLNYLAQQYGVRFDQMGNVQAPAPIDPQIKALQDKLNAVTGHLTNQQQVAQQESIKAAEKQIEDFRNEKTEAGELAHPFFADVEEDMIAIAEFQRHKGIQPNIKDVYEQAVMANPLTREKLLASERSASEKAAIAKAQKARQAGRSVSGSPGSDAGNQNADSNLSVRDLLLKNYGN